MTTEMEMEMEVAAGEVRNNGTDEVTDTSEHEHSSEKKYSGTNKVRYWPNTDGLTHINVHHAGKTELGRLLSNSAKTPFIHPVHGHFASIDGFTYWLSVSDTAPDSVRTQLRFIFGSRAKTVGKQVIRDHGKRHIDNFDDELKRAIKEKILQTGNMARDLKMCELPFAHYHAYNVADWQEREIYEGPNAPQIFKGKEHVVVIPKTYGKVLRILKEIRAELIGEPTAMSEAMGRAAARVRG